MKLFKTLQKSCEEKLKKLLIKSRLSAPLCIEWFFININDDAIKLTGCYSPLNILAEYCQNLATKITNNFEEYELNILPIYINNHHSLTFYNGLSVGISIKANENNKKLLDPTFIDNICDAIYLSICQMTELKYYPQTPIEYKRMAECDINSHVLWLNQKLFAKGFLEEKFVNSTYCQHTKKAVDEFQKHNGLVVDGVVERITFEMLKDF